MHGKGGKSLLRILLRPLFVAEGGAPSLPERGIDVRVVCLSPGEKKKKDFFQKGGSRSRFSSSTRGEKKDVRKGKKKRQWGGTIAIKTTFT